MTTASSGRTSVLRELRGEAAGGWKSRVREGCENPALRMIPPRTPARGETKVRSACPDAANVILGT